jgi:hypothetical protein
MWYEDLGAVLIEHGVGTPGLNMFYSTRALIPPGVGPYIILIATGGMAPDYVQNDTTGPAYQHPGAQVLTRGGDPQATMAKALAAYYALAGVCNRYINGNWYLSIKPTQEPRDIGEDDTGNRVQIVFNVIGDCGR